MRRKLSLSKFAKRLNVSRTAVAKAIAAGRIPAHLVGENTLSTGRRVPVILDAAAARAAFANEGGLDLTVIKGDPPAPRAPVATQPPASDGIPAIAKSRAITELYKAKLARLEYEERSGKLVNAEKTRLKYATLIVTARTRLLGVPSKAKGRIPHLEIDDIQILTTLIREALEQASNPELPEFTKWLESQRETWWPLVAGTSPTEERSP